MYNVSNMDVGNCYIADTNKSVKTIDENFIYIDEWKARAPTLLEQSYDLLTSNDWQIEKVTSDGDVISYMTLPKTKNKIFKIAGTVNVPASKLINYLFDNIESSPSWNKHVDESKIIYVIDENTDIVYQAAKTFGNGLIGARDFVVLRHKGQYGPYYISSNISIDLNAIPKRKNFIRAENGVGCFATQDLTNGIGSKCQFVWILDTKLNGWIPRKIVDMCTSVGFVNFMNSLRLHIESIKD